jgi:uridine kinase
MFLLQMDFRIYVDITPETKFNWKVQRDHEERGHSIESIKQSIEARKPDFDAYIDPQKKKADVIIQVPPEHDTPLPPSPQARLATTLLLRHCTAMPELIPERGPWRLGFLGSRT